MKFALKLDGIASGALGLLALLIRPAVGFPQAFLIGIGAFLVCYGTFAFWLGTRPSPDRRLVLLVIVGNALWVADSVVALEWFPLNGWGVALTIAQALAVAGFIALQVIGLRRFNSSASGSGPGTRPRSPHPAAR